MLNQKSIAVLPFTNISTDPENRYFADGMTDEIINALCKIKGLKVTSRTSSFAYRDHSTDVRFIGNELGVSTILEGSVRNQGNRVRISAQLIRTDTGFQLWAERFDRELSDIFELQDEISRIIADRIRENFGHLEVGDQLVTTRTASPKAYNSYLQGRYYQFQWTQKGLQKALQAYKASIAADPDYPMPYLGLCQCFVYLSAWNFSDRMKGMYMAHHFLSKLGPEHEHIPEYHYTKGMFHFWGKWEFETAAQYFLKTLSLNPNNSDAMQSLASLYNVTGNFKEAHSFIDKAFGLNPNSTTNHYTKATTYYLEKNYKAAIQSLDKCPELENEWTMTSQLKAICLLLLNEENLFRHLVSGFDEIERQKSQHLWHQFYNTAETISLKLIDRTDHHLPIETYILLYEGKQDECLARLQRAIQNRSGSHIHFLSDPLLEPIKHNPAYQELCHATFPQTEISHEEQENEDESNSLLDANELKHFEAALRQAMNNDKVYLAPDITLRSLAERIDLHPNKLSWLLNDHLSMNFNDYINSYRLEAFQQRALNPSNKNYTLLGLAFESGFNSKSSFNDYFKKKTGLTPRVWLKQNK